MWSLITDVTRFTALFSFMTVEDVVCLEPAYRWQYLRQLSIPHVADLRWREEAQVVSDGVLDFHATEGDLSVFKGQWRILPDGAAATLSLTVDYAIPDELGAHYPTPVIVYVMNEIFSTICTRVIEAAEEATA